jgi:DeoR/GlpR family transcriptional regulator of sugar metabolism
MLNGIEIDERKLKILERLRKYDLLTTHQIALLDGGSKQNVSRILNRLDRSGDIVRPYGQRQTFHDRLEP